MNLFITVLTLFLGALPSTSAFGWTLARSQGDTTAVVTGEATCADCFLSSRLLLKLEQGGDAPTLFRTPMLVTDSSNNLIAARGKDGPPVLYDSTGNFVQLITHPDNLGVSAEILVPAPNNAFYVLDPIAERLLFLGPNRVLRGSAPIPHGTISAASTLDGTLIINADVHDAERFGKPYHVFDPVGNYKFSFGGREDPLIPGYTLPNIRLLATAVSGGVWAASPGQYILERWLPNGTRAESIVRESSIIPGLDSWRPYFTRSGPPSPSIVSMMEDERGRLWVTLRKQDPNWREAVTWTRRGTGEESNRPIIRDWDQVFDTVVELIDVKAKMLIVSQHFDEYWGSFVEPGRVQHFDEHADGSFVVEVHELSLHTPRSDEKEVF